jgi:mersacidin/lichenicidin family type 2 lantibiotic
MSNSDVIRAWKDLEYRESLSESERALLPESPVGMVELSDADLLGVGGAEGEQPDSASVALSLSLVGASYAFSCLGNDCDDEPGGTFGDGTCALVSSGCC